MFNSRSTFKFIRLLTNPATKNCTIKKIHVDAYYKERILARINFQHFTCRQNFHLGCQFRARNVLENDEEDGEADEHDTETSATRETTKRDSQLWRFVQKYSGQLPDDHVLSSKQCEQLRNECMDRMAKGRIVDGALLKCFLDKSQIRAGYSYSKFLLQNDLFNPASAILTAKLIYKMSRLGSVEQSFVLKFYDDVLNGKFAEMLQFAPLPHFYCLGSTGRWREALEMFKRPEHRCSSSAQTLILIACLDHKEPDRALDLIQELASNDKTRSLLLGRGFHETYLRFVLEKSKTNPSEAFKYFVKYVELMGLFLCQELPSHLEHLVKAIFENIDTTYRINRTTIGRRNLTCSCCSKSVERESFKPEEYDLMKKALIAEIMEGDDVFRSSTPNEMLMFRKFIEVNAPFDLIFDGLNVIIGGRGRRLGTVPRTKMAINTMQNMAKITNAKKICIVVRAHLLKELPEAKAELKRLGCILTLQDKSIDDPFILYAALASGPRSYVISKDSFSFLNDMADPTARLLLRRWKRTRVIGEWEESFSGRLRITVPPSFAFRFQSDGTNFHIPLYERDEREQVRKEKQGENELPSSTSAWLCISKPNKT